MSLALVLTGCSNTPEPTKTDVQPKKTAALKSTNTLSPLDFNGNWKVSKVLYDEDEYDQDHDYILIGSTLSIQEKNPHVKRMDKNTFLKQPSLPRDISINQEQVMHLESAIHFEFIRYYLIDHNTLILQQAFPDRYYELKRDQVNSISNPIASNQSIDLNQVTCEGEAIDESIYNQKILTVEEMEKLSFLTVSYKQNHFSYGITTDREVIWHGMKRTLPASITGNDVQASLHNNIILDRDHDIWYEISNGDYLTPNHVCQFPEGSLKDMTILGTRGNWINEKTGPLDEFLFMSSGSHVIQFNRGSLGHKNSEFLQSETILSDDNWRTIGMSENPYVSEDIKSDFPDVKPKEYDGASGVLIGSTDEYRTYQDQFLQISLDQKTMRVVNDYRGNGVHHRFISYTDISELKINDPVEYAYIWDDDVLFLKTNQSIYNTNMRSLHFLKRLDFTGKWLDFIEGGNKDPVYLKLLSTSGVIQLMDVLGNDLWKDVY